jgi:Kef-type K+ transport system membrane component KefB
VSYTPQEVFLLAAALVIALPYLVWRFAGVRHVLPLVVVQMLLGLIFGPSVLGHFAPDWHAMFFPAENVERMSTIAMLAVTLFAFQTGMHLQLTSIGERRAFARIAAGSFLLPLLAGCALGAWLAYAFPQAVGTNTQGWQFAFAIGILVAVTALPVLAAVLAEMGLLHTRLGQQAIALAAVNDAGLWVCLSLLLVSLTQAGGNETTPFLIPLYAIAILIVRTVMQRLAAQLPLESRGVKRDGLLVLGCAIAFASAFAAEKVGLGYVFGAFVAGVVMPPALRVELLSRLEAPTVIVLLPFYFVATGLRTDAELFSSAFLGLTAAITLAAILGKVVGVALPARLAGHDMRHSLSLGVLLQSKGLMEVIVVTILLDAGVITSVLFSAVIVMAITCTAIAAPLVRALLWSEAQAGKVAPLPAGNEAAVRESAAGEFRRIKKDRIRPS